jgi:hypothetical protein
VIGAPKFNESGRNTKHGTREGEVPQPFIGHSLYDVTYADFGVLPPANKKAQKKFVAGFGNVDGHSTYQETFNSQKDADFYRKMAEEKQHVQAAKRQHQRGQLAVDTPHPFQGESQSHSTYAKPAAQERVVKHLPFNMVSFLRCDSVALCTTRRVENERFVSGPARLQRQGHPRLHLPRQVSFD